MSVTSEEWAAFRKLVTHQISKIIEGSDDLGRYPDSNTQDYLEYVATESSNLAVACRELLAKL